MQKLLCPECRRTSYSGDTRCFSCCAYCGTKFSGYRGPDKRREERVLYETNGILWYKDKTRHS